MKTTVIQKLFLALFPLFIVAACSKSNEPVDRTLLPADAPSNRTSGMDAETLSLIKAVQKTGAKSTEGKFSPQICEIALPHLDYMIAEGKISHDGYDDRSEKLDALGGTGSGEIVAYNCNSSMSIDRGAESCAKSWKNSSGHWAIMQKYWDGFCYGMKRTGDCYYCIGLFSKGNW